MALNSKVMTGILTTAKRKVLTFCALAFVAVGMAQPTDLIISEYVEGNTGSEKFLELFNGTGAPIDLSDYQIRLYANGTGAAFGTFTTSSALTGFLAPGATIVYKNSGATLYPSAITLAAINFTGNDAVVLWKVSTLSPIDVFGKVACDPGSGWTGTGYQTNDRTLRRKTNVCTGVTANPSVACSATSFPTLTTEWTNFAANTVSGLGSHTVLCGSAVNFAVASASATEAAGSATVTINISPATLSGGNITVAIGGTATYGVGSDYETTPAGPGSFTIVGIPAGATTATFTIAIYDEIVPEGNETITFSISSTTNDLVLGTVLNETFTIIDNDGIPQANFTTLGITALESAGVQTFFLSLDPGWPGGNITITPSPGVGAVCGVGQDYIVTAVGCGPNFTIATVAGASTAQFQVTLYDDAGIVEVTESVVFTITGAPGGAPAIGTSNTSTLNIGDNDLVGGTILTPGDIVIVGVNANNGGCPGGSTGEDFISFFCFKPIEYDTRIIITDNGFQRCGNTGRWGNTEGTVQIRRTGPAIPAGQVVTIRSTGIAGSGNIIGVAPDASWQCTSLNGATTALNMNVGGDQLFFMQGGTWTINTPGSHDAQYTGRILYGFSTHPTFPWSQTCGSPAGNQRSDPPPGMLCFSMAPTASSDFAKYTGPLTIDTQRNWIIRVDNVSNWTSSAYGNCAAYNAGLPNWLLAPILPITPGGFTPGLWRGTTTSKDWFDCKNWDDAEVPLTTTNVRIDETAVNDCEVGVTPGGSAVCASLVQTNSGAAKNLTVRNSSSLVVGGPITVQRTATGSGGAISLTVLAEATPNTLLASNFTVQGTAANEAYLLNEGPNNLVTFTGNLTIGTGGAVDLNGGTPIGGTLFIGGNYANAGPTEANLDETSGKVVFNGALAQSISTTGGFQEVFDYLTVNKSAGNLTLNSPVAVNKVLDLTTGLMNTSSPGGLLTMRSGSSWVNATDASFVRGPMEKIGTTNFVFPVGKGTNMRECRLTGITGAATDAFQAEYFPISAWSWGIAHDPSINHISDCEYWIIGRSAGTADATVVLTWEAPASCGVTNLSELLVARWDGAMWRDRGNGGAAGSFLAGAIPTFTTQTLFSPWTLASSEQSNPLPITLVEFSAKPENGMVRLDWTTASEHENAFFTVERSTDGIDFEHVLDVTGAINSNVPLSYTDLDRNPYHGLSYYRLRQTDTDGNSTVSEMVAVVLGDLVERPLVVFGNSEVLTAVHGFRAGSRYALLDMMGRTIKEGSTTSDGRTDLEGLGLSRGAYVFRLSNGERTESTRFVY